MIEVIDKTVGTGTLATVCVPTTVSNVLRGSVTGPVIDNGGAEVVPFSSEMVASVGCRLVPEMFAVPVGNGCTGGRPSVAIVVIIVPVVTAVLGILPVCDCVLGIGVIVTVSACLPMEKCTCLRLSNETFVSAGVCTFWSPSTVSLLDGRSRGNHLQCTIRSEEMTKICIRVSQIPRSSLWQ